jgi:tripartite-type tricarboxylate transporter receptor subunit TctC
MIEVAATPPVIFWHGWTTSIFFGDRGKPIMRAQCRRVSALALIVVAGVSAVASSGSAQTYPARPVKAITDVGPGGTYDIFVRALGEALHQRWGQPVVVEPRPGGNFIIGGRACAEATPDGYALCFLSRQTLAANEFLYKKIPYQPGSFIPVMNLLYNTQVIFANASLKVRTLDELAVLAKAQPKTLSFSAAGIFQRVFFDRFNQKHGTDLVNVPFKGGGESLTGVLSGFTPIAFIGGANFVPYVRDGKMVALAVDADERSPLFPDTPTFAEAGYPDTLSRSYLSLVVPAGTPQDIIASVHREVSNVMNDKDFRQKNLTDRGLAPIVDSPEHFSRFLESDRMSIRAIVKEAGIQPR